MTRVALTADELAVLGRQRADGAALSDSQARVLGALHAHAFFSPHCCPSQDLLARETGLTREWVNRICRDLWRFGLICWAKAQRLGARWPHNRYALRTWKPAPRARLLALLDRIRKRRLHTEGTTTTHQGRPQGVEASYEPIFECVDVDSRGSPVVTVLRTLRTREAAPWSPQSRDGFWGLEGRPRRRTPIPTR